MLPRFDFRVTVMAMLLTVPASICFAQSGGSNGGGGNFFTPTEQQVIDAVFPALLEVQNVGLDFMLGTTGTLTFGKLVTPDVEFMTSVPYVQSIFKVTDGMDLNNKQNPFPHVEFKKHGTCRGPVGETGAGSVTFPGGKLRLCIALESFTSIPKDYLTKEMAILLAHEVSHIDGKDETAARKAQEWFANYNKVRLDIARFTDGVGEILASRLSTYSMLGSLKPDELARRICEDKEVLATTSRAVDHETRLLRREDGMSFFHISFPDVNQKEFWMRKVGNLLVSACAEKPNLNKLNQDVHSLNDEFAEFFGQFGMINAQELND